MHCHQLAIRKLQKTKRDLTQNMIKRILTGWTFTRWFYVLIGGMIIAQSIAGKQWFEAAIGAYFASMGIFAFGCASGGCFGGHCSSQPEEKPGTQNEEVKFEEIKMK